MSTSWLRHDGQCMRIRRTAVLATLFACAACGTSDQGAMSCPAHAPVAGSPCALVGLPCRFGEPLVDYLCTNDLVWRERRYQAPAATPPDPGLAQPLAAAVSCRSNTPSCPDSRQCVVQCCSGGGGSGCAGCCADQFCNLIPAEDCPQGRCRLARDCSGAVVCRQALPSNWLCGTAGSYLGPCCEGLTASCATMLTDGSCDPVQGYNGDPMCFACGDGVCEYGEDRCNCPADCH
jgi:hypothetical protein